MRGVSMFRRRCCQPRSPAPRVKAGRPLPTEKCPGAPPAAVQVPCVLPPRPLLCSLHRRGGFPAPVFLLRLSLGLLRGGLVPSPVCLFVVVCVGVDVCADLICSGDSRLRLGESLELALARFLFDAVLR